MAHSLLSADPELAFVASASDAGNRSSLDASMVRDWSRVLELAVRHRVYPRVAQSAGSLIPAEIHEKLRGLVQQNAQATLRNLARTREAVRLLDSHGIESIVLKGPILARELYGDVSLRVSGDIDLLVREADFIRAAQLFAAEGYQHHTPTSARALARHRRRQHDISFAHPADSSLVELHADIAQPHYGYRFDLDTWWGKRMTTRVGDADLGVLSLEHGYLMAALHAAKHRWERLDLICDIAVYGRKDLNWADIRAESAEAWLLTAIRTGESIAAAFFADERPLEGVTAMAVRKVIAGEPFRRLDGAAFDLALRERTTDKAAYLLRRLLSAKLRV